LRLGEKLLFAVLAGTGDPKSLSKAQRTQRESRDRLSTRGMPPEQHVFKLLTVLAAFDEVLSIEHAFCSFVVGHQGTLSVKIGSLEKLRWL
jgi:hypothetical protein